MEKSITLNFAGGMIGIDLSLALHSTTITTHHLGITSFYLKLADLVVAVMVKVSISKLQGDKA